MSPIYHEKALFTTKENPFLEVLEMGGELPPARGPHLADACRGTSKWYFPLEYFLRGKYFKREG